LEGAMVVVYWIVCLGGVGVVVCGCVHVGDAKDGLEVMWQLWFVDICMCR
jgi:hypothetical protein